jgi:hypothetical protein
VCGSTQGSVLAVRAAVCGSALGISVRQCTRPCAAMRQCRSAHQCASVCVAVRAAVCAQSAQCAQQCVAVRLVVNGSAAVRVWHCGTVR